MKPADCIELGHGRWIPKHAISFEAIRASGPGGQHVNKVATAVRMRVVLEHVKGLNPESRQRLVVLLGRREKRWGCDASLGCVSIAADQSTHRDQAALPIWFTRPHLPLSNGSQPNPLDLRSEKDCRTKSTTAAKKDSVGNVILKRDQWTPVAGFKPSAQLQCDPFEPHRSCEPSRPRLPISRSHLRRRWAEQ